MWEHFFESWFLLQQQSLARSAETATDACVAALVVAGLMNRTEAELCSCSSLLKCIVLQYIAVFCSGFRLPRARDNNASLKEENMIGA